MARAPEYPPVRDPSDPHPEEPKRVEAIEVRQAIPVGHMRYVLGIGIVLVVAAFIVAYYLAI